MAGESRWRANRAGAVFSGFFYRYQLKKSLASATCLPSRARCKLEKQKKISRIEMGDIVLPIEDEALVSMSFR